MTFVVFLFSAVLFVLGVISIYSGYPMIQIERGWAEVISGAVAVSGAVVAFAVAAVLIKLQAIHRALAGAAVRSGPSKVAKIPAFAATDDVELRPTLSEASLPELAESRVPGSSPTLEPEPVEPPSDVRHGLWKRIRLGDEGNADVPQMPGADQPLGPAELTPVIPVEEPTTASGSAETMAPEVLAPLSSDREAFPRLRPTLADASSFRSRTPETDDSSIDWLDQGLRSRPAHRFELGSEVDTTRPMSEEDGHEPPLSHHPSAPTFVEPEPVAGDADPTPSESTSEVTIVGRYQAGVASYVMYSDGTIEVETEGEMVRRFGSMEELKAFINRHETPVS